MLYQLSEPFVMDPSRFDRTFAVVVTLHEEAARRTSAGQRPVAASLRPTPASLGKRRPVVGR